VRPLDPSEPPPEPPPPAAAEAGKLIAIEPDPNEPLDLTGSAWVVGTAQSFAGGVTSSTGTSKRAVHAPASGTGVPGGQGKPDAPPAQDLSRTARPVSLDPMENCGFPPQADAEQVNSGVVRLAVTVGTDGAVKSVAILSESPAGVGFASRAKTCANRARYKPALDVNGRPVVGTTPPIRVRFVR
jgi:protein TonB